MTRKKDEEIMVLYVEDDSVVRDIWLDYIQKQYPRSVGFRSHEEVLDLLEDGEIPDMVILDRGILKYKDDDVDQPEAGDALYMELINRGIPVAVLSAETNLEHMDPYYSHPPELGIFSKSNTELELKQALENFKKRG